MQVNRLIIVPPFLKHISFYHLLNGKLRGKRNNFFKRLFSYLGLYYAGTNSEGQVGAEGGNGGGGMVPKLYKSGEIITPVSDTGLVDLNSDGLPDIIYSPGIGQWYWWRNLGNGQFADRASFTNAPPIQFNDVGVRFSDVDGDGLLDLVRIEGQTTCVAQVAWAKSRNTRELIQLPIGRI